MRVMVLVKATEDSEKGFVPTPETMESFTSSINIMQLVADPLIATVTTLVSTAGVATLYSELRGSREGVGPEALASVFD